MLHDLFAKIIEIVPELTFGQRKSLMERLEKGDPSHQVRELLEKDTKRCPHCDCDDVGGWGQSHGLSRYRCRGCGRTFNSLTNTPLARLRLKDRWLDFAKTLLDGESVRKSAETCGVHKNTSFRWRHLFLKLPATTKSVVLNGIVEADEMFVLHSDKGQRDLDRPARKRGGEAKKPGRSGEQVCILVARDRAGHTVDHVSRGFDKDIIAQVLNPVLAKDVILCSDGLSSYKAFCREHGFAHKILNLSAGIRVVDDVFHIQNVNAYHSRFKGWLHRFHGVASKYLPNYLGWFWWLDQNRSILAAKPLLAVAAGAHQQLMVT